MITIWRCMAIVAGLLVLSGGTPAREKQIVSDEAMAEIALPAPKRVEDRQYLGLTDDSTFTVPQIKARVVIVQAFSMYCPHCQREAPHVNTLFKTIHDNPELRDQIRLIGIGVGNSAFEVGVFQLKYNVPFPLFSDSDFSIHKKLGEVRTPSFFVVRNDGNGTCRVVYEIEGPFETPDTFLKAVLDRVEF